MNRRTLALALLLLVALVALWRVEGRTETALTPLEAGAEGQFDVAYGDHPRNRLDVYTPDSPGPHPVIIWMHPGGWIAGDKAASMPVWDWTDRGYAIVAVNYRYALSPDTVAGAVDDAIHAVELVIDRHADWDLDVDRIGIYGFSAGGHLAAMVAHQGLPVRAIAIAGAPTDFGPMLDPAVPFFDGKRGADVVEVAHQLLGCSDNTDRCDALATDVSPAQLSPGTVDLLIVHGESDHIVDVDQARRLFDHLQAQGATPELVIVEAGGHVPHVDEGGIDQFFDDRLLS